MPSIGMTPIQRTCPGRRDKSAGTNISSHIPPRNFAPGDGTFRERNHLIPSTAANRGSKNAPIPHACKSKSETSAPAIPIQFLAAREPVKTEALFNEGSSGEYEANARNKRSAEIHNRNPISSLSRRLLVGAKIRGKTFIQRISRIQANARHARPTPEPFNYAKKHVAPQLGISRPVSSLVSCIGSGGVKKAVVLTTYDNYQPGKVL